LECGREARVGQWQGVKLFGGDNRHSIEKARRELGYEPQIAVREGVRRAAEWYREQRTRNATATVVSPAYQDA